MGPAATALGATIAASAAGAASARWLPPGPGGARALRVTVGSLLVVSAAAAVGGVIDASRSASWGLAAGLGAAALAWGDDASDAPAALLAAASATQAAAAIGVDGPSSSLPLAVRAVGIVALGAAAFAQRAWVGVLLACAGAVGAAVAIAGVHAALGPSACILAGIASSVSARALARLAGPHGSWLILAALAAAFAAGVWVAGGSGAVLVAAGMMSAAETDDARAIVALACGSSMAIVAAFANLAAATRCAEWIARESLPVHSVPSHCEAAGFGAIAPEPRSIAVVVCAAAGVALVAAQCAARITHRRIAARSLAALPALFVAAIVVAHLVSLDAVASLLLAVVVTSALAAVVLSGGREPDAGRAIASSSLLCGAMAAALAPTVR